MRLGFFGMLCAFIVIVSASPTEATTYTTISLASIANFNLQDFCPAYPSASSILGGVNFNIGVANTLNVWNAHTAAGGTPTSAVPVSVTIPLNATGFSGVHTLVNTSFGVAGPQSLAAVTFGFSDLTTYTKNLIGNDDIRDLFNNVAQPFTNSINGTTTTEVFSAVSGGITGTGTYRLDKQYFDLSGYAGKTLTSVTLNDTGSNAGVQRVALMGMTLQNAVAVPEPASACFLLIGGASLVGVLRKRTKQQ